jgi:hypothetical protein
MGLRTYLPTLRVVLKATCNYINEHYDDILRFLGEEHKTRLDAANTACNVLVDILNTIIPNPS